MKSQTIRTFFYTFFLAMVLGAMLLAPWLVEPLEVIKARDASIVNFSK